MNQQKKIVFVVTALVALLLIFTIFSFANNRNRSGIDALINALDRGDDITCQIAPRENVEGLVLSETILVSGDDLRLNTGFDSEDATGWQSFDLLLSGGLYSWQSNSRNGVFENTDLTARQYLLGNEQSLQEVFNPDDVSCESGVANEQFAVPQDIIFGTDDIEIDTSF